MKNVKLIIRKIIVPLFFACILFPQISFSQDMEFLWAKKIGGVASFNVASVNPHFVNKIHSAVMDSVGNTYVLGNFCAASKIDELSIIPDTLPTGEAYWTGVFVAKFDTIGNLVWKKCSRTRENMILNPMSMTLKNNELTMGFYGMIGCSALTETNWFFFFDTIMYQDFFQPSDNPYSLNVNDNRWYAFFVTFDLDGGIKDFHYIDFKYTRLYPDSRFVLDNQNNICLFASLAEDNLWNRNWTPSRLPHLVVDGDTTKRFMFDFYDGDTTKPHRQQFFSFLKFDTNWNVVAYKRLVDTYTNTSFDLEAAEGRTYEAWPEEMSLYIDEENNRYVSGLMHAEFSLQDTAVHYYINLDSAHHLTVESALGAHNGIPFIIKYDPDGNVIWSQQLYYQSLRLYDYTSVYPYQSFGGLDSNYVYYLATIASDFYSYRGFTDSIYAAYPFFDENHKIPIETSGFSYGYSVCIAYNRNNGSLVDYFQLIGQSDSAYVAVRTPMIIDSNYFRQALYIKEPQSTDGSTVWYTLNRKTGEVNKSTDIFGMIEHFDMVHPHGFVLRIGYADHIYNDYFDFTGHSFSAIVLYYDSTLDCRRQPAIIPQDSTSISSAPSHQFTLFPNPASSMVRVIDARSGDLMPNITEISIFSMQGKKILSLSNASQFDISNLATGTYIVKLVSKTDTVEYLKLIKK